MCEVAQVLPPCISALVVAFDGGLEAGCVNVMCVLSPSGVSSKLMWVLVHSLGVCKKVRLLFVTSHFIFLPGTSSTSLWDVVCIPPPAEKVNSSLSFWL